MTSMVRSGGRRQGRSAGHLGGPCAKERDGARRITFVASASSNTSLLLEGLNPVQAEAVLHTDGPVLIVAGAGSGKTRALTHRVAYLIREQGVSPYEILAITFTNKAAQEMADRVEGLLGTRVASGMWILTFHSACVRL